MRYPVRVVIHILSSHLRNVEFEDFRRLVEAFGFRVEHLNLQPRRGEAKPYQIRQFLALVEHYNLRMGDGS